MLISFIALAAAVATPTSASLSAPCADPLPKAEKHWERRCEIAEAEQAVTDYRTVPADSPHAYESCWRLARGYWWLADHRPSRRQAYLEAGVQAAEKAIALCPDAIEGHYWLGACAGLLAADRNDLSSLALVDQSKKEMERVAEMDPENGLAQYTLGVLYRKAPGWPFSIGDKQKALDYAREAVRCRPDVVLTHIGLAEVLLDLNRKQEAREILEHALQMPGPPGQLPETKDQKTYARRLLSEIR